MRHNKSDEGGIGKQIINFMRPNIFISFSEFMAIDKGNEAIIEKKTGEWNPVNHNQNHFYLNIKFQQDPDNQNYNFFLVSFGNIKIHILH